MRHNQLLLSIIVLGFLAITQITLASESFDINLYFGLKGDSEVIRLQQFLTNEGIYSGPKNGNFYALTREAVKKYQKTNNIEPISGYVGSITRESINNKLGNITAVIPRTSNSAQIAVLRLQIDALLKQLAILQTTTPIVVSVQKPVATITIIQEIVATTTPEVVATTASALPSSFDSTLQIKGIYPSFTLSSYGDKILHEFKMIADEKIAITRMRFKNTGTWNSDNVVGLELVRSQDNSVLANADHLTDNIIDFKITPNIAKPDNGLVISGGTYYIHASLITPNYGAIKPYIKLDINSASDIDAFDYNDLSRKASLKSIVFPIEGPQITAF